MVTAMAARGRLDDPAWHETTVDDAGTGHGRGGRRSAGADLVARVRGDGTVREVCAEMAGTGMPVGIVPAGTGNLLARNLGIPLFIRAAIDVALQRPGPASTWSRSPAMASSRPHFMVMAGMGLDAAIMEGVPRT